MSDEKKKIDIDIDVSINGKDKIDSTKDSLESLAGAGKKLPGVFGEVAEGAEGLASGIGSATKAALTFLATPIGLVLGAIAVAIGAVTAAFKGSEEGQNKFSKIMSVIGAVVGKVVEVFASIGEIIIDAFEHPMDSIKKFVTMVKENIINRFTGLLELIPHLGSAINKLFHGDFKGAGKEAADAVAKVALGVEHMTDKVAAAGDALIQFGKDAAATAKKAAALADQRAKADIEERKFSEGKLKAEAKIAEIREKIADKEGVSAKERLSLIKEAQELDEKLFGTEKRLADQRVDIAQKTFDLKKKHTKEEKNELQEIQNKAIEVDIEKAKSGKTLEKALTTTNREISAEAKKIAAERAKEIKEHEKLIKDLNAKELKGVQEVTRGTLSELDKKTQAIQDASDIELARLQDLKDEGKLSQEEFTKFSVGLETKRLGDIANLQKEEADKAAKKAEEEAKKTALKEIELSKKALKAKADAEIAALEDDAIAKLKIQDKLISDEHDLEIQAATLKGEDVASIEDEFRAQHLKNVAEMHKAEIALAKKQQDEEFKLAEDLEGSLQNLSSIAFDFKNANLQKGSAAALAAAKEQFNINKALNLSSAVITGVQSVMNAFSNGMKNPVPLLGPATAAIYAAIAGVTSAANIAKIASTQFNTTSGAGVTGSRGGSSSIGGSFTPQSLQQIGGSGQSGITNPNSTKPNGGKPKPEPQKVYVVASDITTSQNKNAVLSRRASFSL